MNKIKVEIEPNEYAFVDMPYEESIFYTSEKVLIRDDHYTAYKDIVLSLYEVSNFYFNYIICYWFNHFNPHVGYNVNDQNNFIFKVSLVENSNSSYVSNYGNDKGIILRNMSGNRVGQINSDQIVDIEQISCDFYRVVYKIMDDIFEYDSENTSQILCYSKSNLEELKNGWTPPYIKMDKRIKEILDLKSNIENYPMTINVEEKFNIIKSEKQLYVGDQTLESYKNSREFGWRLFNHYCIDSNKGLESVFPDYKLWMRDRNINNILEEETYEQEEG